MIACKNDQGDDTGSDEALKLGELLLSLFDPGNTYKVYRETCGYCYEETAILSQLGCLIAGLGSIGCADRIFATSTKSSNSTSDNHHPEHAVSH